MKERRAGTWVLVAVIALCGGLWFGGKALSDRHGGYFLRESSEFLGESSADAFRVTVCVRAVEECRPSWWFPLIVNSVATTEYRAFVEVSSEEQADVRIVSAEAVVGERVVPLPFLISDPRGMPASEWHALESGAGHPTGNGICHYVRESLVIPPGVASVRARVHLEVRVGGDVRAVETTLEMPRKESRSSRFYWPP